MVVLSIYAGLALLRNACASATMHRSVRSNCSRKSLPKPGCRWSHHRAAASSSSNVSGWLTTRIEPIADFLDHLLHRATTHFAFLDFATAPVNDIVPFRFRIGVHDVVEAGDELSSVVLHEVGGTGVPPHVGCDVLGDLGSLGVPCHQRTERVRVDGRPSVAKETVDFRREPSRQLGPQAQDTSSVRIATADRVPAFASLIT